MALLERPPDTLPQAQPQGMPPRDLVRAPPPPPLQVPSQPLTLPRRQPFSRPGPEPPLVPVRALLINTRPALAGSLLSAQCLREAPGMAG